MRWILAEQASQLLPFSPPLTKGSPGDGRLGDVQDMTGGVGGGALSPFVSQLLWNRGLRDQKDIQTFLKPDWNTGIHDPFTFADMEKATTRILRAIESDEHIKILADYDADGITSGTILYETLQFLGAKDLSIYIPNRFTEGYGIRAEVINQCKAEGVGLAISVDVGITAHEALKKAKGFGIDVIVCDHHHPKETVPPAYAILHPHLPGETYPFKDLSGVGVTYKLVQGLLKYVKEHNSPQPSLTLREGEKRNPPLKIRGDRRVMSFDAFEKWLLDLVAIGTVADIVPVLGENRTLVKYGLIVLNKTKRTGLRELILRAGLKLGTMQEESTALSTRNIGWQIAPRLNAASRMEHGVVAFQLLSEKDEARAKDLAEQLDSANKERQELTFRITEETRTLMDQEEDAAVLSSFEWSSTVCGLVAGRLADEFFMPVFLFEQKGDMFEGSGRSVDGIDIMEVLDECKELLFSYGGHPMACGLKIQGIERFEKFKTLVKESVKKRIPKNFEKTLHLELVLPFAEITQDLISTLKMVEPFGEGNPKPLFWFKKCRVVQLARVGGQGNHLKLQCSQGERMMKAMKFNVKEDISIAEGDVIDIAGEIEESIWNGNREVFIKVKDIKLSE